MLKTLLKFTFNGKLKRRVRGIPSAGIRSALDNILETKIFYLNETNRVFQNDLFSRKINALQKAVGYFQWKHVQIFRKDFSDKNEKIFENTDILVVWLSRFPR